MKLLLSSDLHLTDNPEDRYRWDVMSWIGEQADLHRVDEIHFLGDLTDKKDRHNAALVNRIVDMIGALAYKRPVHILMGNHDFIAESDAFFKFLGRIPGVYYYDKPYDSDFILALPFSRTPVEAWTPHIKTFEGEYIFFHGTIDGCVVENGTLMSGIPRELFKGFRAFAGDIHVPQVLGPVTYVGAPYPIRFGDKFQPRILLLDLDTGETESIPVPTLKKHTLTISNPSDLEHVNWSENDQVKVRLSLPVDQMGLLDSYKERIQAICQKDGVKLSGLELMRPTDTPYKDEQAPKLSNGDIFDSFCKKEQLSQALINKGRTLFEAT